MFWTVLFAVAAIGPTLPADDSLALKSPFIDGSDIVVRTPASKLSPLKESPKGGFKFDIVTSLFATVEKSERERMRVFGQSPEASLVNTPAVARLLGRLFDFNCTSLRLDHSPLFGDQRVDVYLCQGGEPGGEQMFGEDPYTKDSSGRPTRVNTVYLYDVDTLEDALEACREIAHEYGHAVLPPVQVQKGREQWANGHLGERIYLTWLRDALRQKKLQPSDVLGLKATDLDRYFDSKVRPIINDIAKNGPNVAALKTSDDRSFAGYLALACYAYCVLPIENFRRSLVLNPDQTPIGYAKAVVMATNERANVPLKILIPGSVWVPLGTGRLTGCKVMAKANGWAKVQATGPVVLHNSDE